VIGHELDPSAVGEWVARDPVLRRLVVPAHAPLVSLVGGAVRDALIGVTHGADVDLVVEGDAIALARVIGRDLGGRVVAHDRFGTARLEFAHGRHVDMVGCRRETYPAPGALPVVVPGSLDDDLGRRDFTVNAMAYRLSGPDAGTLVDPHGGRGDLEAARIRLIRHGAFAEDPSRVIRALRYAARLGFRMDDATAAEARTCLATLDLGSSRVGDELRRLLDEDSAPAALTLARALGASWPEPGTARDAHLAALPRILGRPGAPSPPTWALRLGLGLTSTAADGAALPQWARAVAAEVRAGLLLAERVGNASPASAVDAVLRDTSPAEQVGALVAGADSVATWWAQWRDLTPAISGADLVAAGVPPGPAIGRALAAVRADVLDGVAGDRAQQLHRALAVAGVA
jgi:tRNA nucleotidyltransferase (CCA-adding enzyme)